jgi:hypothetical protein
LFFIVSIPFKSFTLVSNDVIYGYQILLFGWLGFFVGQEAWYCWYLNFLFIYCLFEMLIKKKTNLLFSVPLLFLIVRTLFINEFFYKNEGVPTLVKNREIGFYFWFLSIFLFSISAIVIGILNFQKRFKYIELEIK